MVRVEDIFCRNIKLNADESKGESWQRIVLHIQAGHKCVEKELDQIVSAKGQRLCCTCKRVVAGAEPYVEGGVTASSLSAFCSSKCVRIAWGPCLPIATLAGVLD